MSVSILETPRLRLREFTPSDAAFVRALLNDPDWIRFIGDRNVHTDDEARVYLENGPIAQYRKLGFGLWLVERKADGEPMGMCGLVKRDQLDDVDLGFAFLPAFRSQGYAREAAAGVLELASKSLGFKRVAAIFSPHNASSRRLLGALGFVPEATLAWKPDEPVELHAWTAPSGP